MIIGERNSFRKMKTSKDNSSCDEEVGLKQLDTSRQQSFHEPLPSTHQSSKVMFLQSSISSSRRTKMSCSSSKMIRVQSTKLDLRRMTRTQLQIYKAKLLINKILNNAGVSTVMTLFTIYALYGDDMRMLLTQPSADAAFTWMSSIAFFLFIAELVLSCLAKPEYFQWNGFLSGEERTRSNFYKYLQIGSFYFWLDVIATASLCYEISWIYDAGSETESVNNTQSDSGLQSARAGRASRAGARAGRVVRVVRMVRLVRLVKLYRLVKEHLSFKKENLELAKREFLEEEDEEMPPESRVGAMMSDLTTRRVIVGVLMMLVCIPLLLFEDDDMSMLFGLNLVHNFGIETSVYGTTSQESFQYAVDDYCSMTETLISLTVFGASHFLDDMGDRRDEELKIFTVTETINGTEYISQATIDYKPVTKEIALYGILLTTFVICLLAAGSMIFTRDVNTLVINPIEVMVALVRKINEDPIGFDYKVNQSFQEGLETTMLLQTIQKIGGLMRVGFGEAGASIIGKNLNEGTGQKLNLLTAGTKIQAIFGFCDIRNFTDTTECLQSEVMLFVNRIASILHDLVAQCNGAANKNIGDAFLLTWKIEENWSTRKVADIADQALYSFCLTVAEMSKHGEFVCQFTPQALNRLYARMPGYKVKMGFGLHYGWAIEGAIGSERKIDASYISPHVNMSEYLESSTKQFGVGLLMSEAFYKLLSNEPKKYIRKLDRIKRAKSEDPMCLYTYDMEPEQFIRVQTAHRRTGRRRSSSLRNSAQDLIGKIASRITKSGMTPPLHSPNNHHSTILEISSVQSTGEHTVQGPLKSARGVHRQSRPSEEKMFISPRLLDSRGNKRTPNEHLLPKIEQPDQKGKKKEKGKHKNRRKNMKKVQPRDSPPTSLSGTGGNTFFKHNELSLGKVKEDSIPRLSAAGRLHSRRSSISLTSTSITEEKAAIEAPVIQLAPYSKEVWAADEDLQIMRHRYTDGFIATWAEAMDLYIQGDWGAAHRIFQSLHIMLPLDGPTKFMLQRTEGERAPENWEGFFDLSA